MLMVYVPAGEFEMGSEGGRSDESPAHTVALDAFWIDQTEVTNGRYQQCVQAGSCDSPLFEFSETRHAWYGRSEYDDFPVVWITWDRAYAYCSWAGARLPTEAEWEYAARGPEGLQFPWGDEFDGTRLNWCDAECAAYHGTAEDASIDDGHFDTAPVGSYPDGASWCGALDMAGNVEEWVADRYGSYASDRQVNPEGPSSGDLRVMRGGSLAENSSSARGASRGAWDPGVALSDFGFRCAKDAD
jgi:serine/threonine-protein kinase